MSRKISAYGRRRAHAAHLADPLIQKARGAAALLATLKAGRVYTDDTAMPGELEGAEDLLQKTARKAELQVRIALDGLLRCEKPQDPTLDFSRLKHAVGVATIRSLQMIYGTKRQDPFEEIDLRALTPEQAHAVEVLHEGNKALNAAYDRWEATGGYGLDGVGRQALIDAVDLYTLILTSSTPTQMELAHKETLKIRKLAIESREGVAA